ncbi:LOW QUALITY PROTEIN: hypothetical protein V2J09_000401 [Rumex salicifolius]
MQNRMGCMNLRHGDVDENVVRELMNMLDANSSSLKHFGWQEIGVVLTQHTIRGQPDILIEKKTGDLQRISEIHPQYMALQYPLLFPYGEDGFHLNIPYKRKRQTKRGNATMREFYCYRIQQRLTESTTLIEATRLSFGNPALFIPFTANPKWPEVAEMLSAIPGQTAQDRPDIMTRVFKLKLTQLMRDLRKNKIFGKSPAIVYTIEFQKRGLPHAHILLWLKRKNKTASAAEIVDIISAEIPSKIKHPQAHKLVADHMVHGPDKATAMVVHGGSSTNNAGKTHYIDVDEIKIYLDCRYLSACERIFGFEIHSCIPAVINLPLHLPDGNTVVVRDSNNLASVLNRAGVKESMFTAWSELNKVDPRVRESTYAEIPRDFVWNAKDKLWQWRKQRTGLGRITVGGVVYDTFKQTCYALGMLTDDKEWNDAIQEAKIWATGSQLRHLFVTILLFCDIKLRS